MFNEDRVRRIYNRLRSHGYPRDRALAAIACLQIIQAIIMIAIWLVVSIIVSAFLDMTAVEVVLVSLVLFLFGFLAIEITVDNLRYNIREDDD